MRGRVLVVDDLESEMIALMLRHEGFEVERAESADEAEALAPGGYDCFLLDGAMPRVDGFTLARRLVAAGYTAPIVFATAFGDEITRQHASAIGAFAVIEKPLAPDVLAETVGRAIASRVLRADGTH